MPPLGFLIDRMLRDTAQAANHSSVESTNAGRDLTSRWFIHERHKLIGKAGHGAANADAANVRTSANSSHPAALGHITLDYRAPAANFDKTFRRAILLCEVSLLVVPSAVTAFMDSLTEKPLGT